MHLGTTIRNMGEQAVPDVIGRCAECAEEAGLESVWVVDHLAIPPDDAEGSGGRYIDPLIALAWLAGATRRIRLGVGVLILPYRSALPTVKQIASLQELSGERLILGAGVGWMKPEFRALGVDRSRRGRIADGVLDLLNRCFAGDEVTENGQAFLFRPRPRKPPSWSVAARRTRSGARRATGTAGCRWRCRRRSSRATWRPTASSARRPGGPRERPRSWAPYRWRIR